jgi:hypothetical protein
MAVQPAEARRRHRLIHRCEVDEPRIAFGDALRVMGQLLRKACIDQAGISRSAAVMREAHDRAQAMLAEQRQPFVGPGPIHGAFPAWRRALPKYRVANGAYAQRC